MGEPNPALDAARGTPQPPPQPQPAQAGAQGATPPPQMPPPPPPTPDSVVALAEMVTMLAVKAFCVSSGVEMNKEIETLCLLSPQEKKQLESIAPYAMPFIVKMLQNLPALGGLAFVGMYSLMLARRYNVIKKYVPAPPREKIKDAELARPA